MLDPTQPVMTLLDRYGPDGPGPGTGVHSEAEALAYVRGLATAHYENFSVLSSLVPADLRADFAAVYAFCRWADDLGDETGRDAAARERSLLLLNWWENETKACFDGRATHPVFVALLATARRRGLPRQPFLDLVDAFKQDQRVMRYQTWDEVVDYCRRSANPVGRIVLHLGGYPDTAENAERYRLSDATCTALQLINFWQDVRRDLLERDRVYVPVKETGVTAEMLADWAARPGDPGARVPYILSMRPLVQRTRELFAEGAPLTGMLSARIRPVVWLFGAGGMAVLRQAEAIGCATLWERPRLSRLTKLGLVARAWASAKLAPRREASGGAAGAAA